jgi:hypothetical protein
MNECIPVEEIGALARLPGTDPRRRHAAACPRCSALLFAYEEFMRADEIAGADTSDADARLSEFVTERIEQAPAVRAAGSPRADRTKWFSFSLLRTAAVAAMVVVGVVALARWQPWTRDEIVPRGDVATEIAGMSASTMSDGTVELRWNAVSGADNYRVVLLAEDLSELKRMESTEPAVRVGTDVSPWYWQVVALREGGELVVSDPERFAPIE